MSDMRSPGRAESAEKTARQTGVSPGAGGSAEDSRRAAPGGGSVTANSSEHDGEPPVVLWDEVKAPDPGEAKSAAKDLPADPSAH